MRKLVIFLLALIPLSVYGQVFKLSELKTDILSANKNSSVDVSSPLKFGSYFVRANADSIWLEKPLGTWVIRLDNIKSAIPLDSVKMLSTYEAAQIYLKAVDTTNYISKSQARKDIHDSIASIDLRVPELSIKMANDTIDYEMTGSAYNLSIQYTLKRPTGCKPITSVKVNGANYTVPSVNEGQTVTGTLAISFTGPSYSQGVLSHSQLYSVAVAAGKDTVKQDITLNQYWRMYMAFAGYDPSFNGEMSPYLYTNTTIKPLVKNGVCEVLNFNPAGNQIIIAVPTGYDGNLKVINGITLNLFIPAVQTFYNLTNAKGATHRYEAFYTDNSFLRTLQKFELR